MSSGIGRERELSDTTIQVQKLREGMNLLDKISGKAEALAVQDAVDGPGFLSFVDTFKGEVISSLAGTTSPLSGFRMTVSADIRQLVQTVFVDTRKVKVALGTGSIVQETKVPGLFFRNQRGLISNQRRYSIVGTDHLSPSQH